MNLKTIGEYVFRALSTVKQMGKDKAEQATLLNIQTKLKQMDGKLDHLAKDVNSLAVGQQKLAATSLYGRDVSRLRFFLSYLVNFLSQTDNGLQPANLANEWADNVLDLGGDGVAQVCLICNVPCQKKAVSLWIYTSTMLLQFI